MKRADEIQQELHRRIQTEGVVAAYEAALDVARDKKAAPAARATASATLFRVAGYFDKAADADHEIPPQEMTPEQLQTAAARIVGIYAPRKSDPFD